MESSIEKKRAKLFRLIAWSLSIAIHLGIIYFLAGNDQGKSDLNEETSMESPIRS